MRTRWIMTILLLPLIIGCAAKPNLRVVLLPDQAKSAGSVIIKSPQSEVTLDQSYMAADVYEDNKIESKVLDPEAVQKQFGQALSAQPLRPVSYILYFIVEKDELTSESKMIMNKIKVELEQRPFPQIIVIGHTDRIGTDAYNDALALKRAEMVRRILIEAGFSAAGIETAGRGSRELLVPTGEGVPEPQNRRVEISIR